MHYFAEYSLFLAEIATFVVAILLVVAGIVAISSKNKSKEFFEIVKLNDKYLEMEYALKEASFSKEEYKKFLKSEKKAEKKREKETRPRIFVIDFDGDIKASAVDELREVITALLTVATPKDQVLLRLESGGGLVHTYGLAASQLDRIKSRKIPLIVSVDKVAASGGYLMACIANTILAAPFAILGSIGVLAQLPNFHRLLKKNNIDFEQIHAGEYKRTLTMFGENTDKGREKFRSEIEEVHTLFKDFVREHRPVVDIEQIATGEHWYGTQALALQLADEIMTSDDFLLNASRTQDLYLISYKLRKPLVQRLVQGANTLVSELKLQLTNQSHDV